MKTIHVWRASLFGAALLFAPLATTPVLAQAAGSESAKKVQAAASEKLQYIGQLVRFDETQIALGKLALSKSDNTRIRSLAQNMIDVHTLHLNQLGSWARARAAELRTAAGQEPGMGVGGAGSAGMQGLPPATGSGGTESGGGLLGIAGSMDAYVERAQQHRAMLSSKYADLMKQTGHSFDKDWVDAVRDSQREGASMLKDGIDKYATDASFASLLTRTEPVLQRNLRQVDALAPTLK